MEIYSYGKRVSANLGIFMVKVKNPIGYCFIFIQHRKKGPEPTPMGCKINIQPPHFVEKQGHNLPTTVYYQT
jgi:hypothetical protein